MDNKDVKRPVDVSQLADEINRKQIEEAKKAGKEYQGRESDSEKEELKVAEAAAVVKPAVEPSAKVETPAPKAGEEE